MINFNELVTERLVEFVKDLNEIKGVNLVTLTPYHDIQFGVGENIYTGGGVEISLRNVETGMTISRLFPADDLLVDGMVVTSILTQYDDVEEIYSEVEPSTSRYFHGRLFGSNPEITVSEWMTYNSVKDDENSYLTFTVTLGLPENFDKEHLIQR